MVEYICQKCFRIFNHKGNYEYHINKKNNCVSIPKNKTKIEKNHEEILENLKLLSNNTIKEINQQINTPEIDESVKIFNQMTETHSVKDLAKIISKLTGIGIEYISNPRKESLENELYVENQCFIDLGLKPIKLDEALLIEVKDIAKKYSANCIREKIISTSFWTKEQEKN